VINLNFLTFFRALSFGGLVGSGVAGLLYLKFPQVFAGVVGIKTFIFFGACLGAGCQQLIEKLVGLVLKPVSDFISYYEKLVELAILRQTGQINDKEHASIVFQLTEQRFLGKRAIDVPALPPKDHG
jgi:hypothetical protein